MTVKSEVSSRHLDALLQEHGNKPLRFPARVILTGNQKPGSIGDEIYRYLRRASSTVWSYSGDVTQPIDHLEVNGGDFCTLIMCHGATYLEWFEEAPTSKIKEIFDVNLFGTYNMAQAFVKATINKPYRKRIISIGSMAHRAVLNGSAAYCASKAGLAHLTRCMAWELAPKGYDVYCIHPSNTLDTPMSTETIKGLERYRGLTLEQAISYWNDSSIRQKSLTKSEIANIIGLIIEHKLEYLSGSQIELAGGQR